MLLHRGLSLYAILNLYLVRHGNVQISTKGAIYLPQNEVFADKFRDIYKSICQKI